METVDEWGDEKPEFSSQKVNSHSANTRGPLVQSAPFQMQLNNNHIV
jgi:hypothetical protein